MNRILLVNAIVRNKLRSHYIQTKCDNVVILENEKTLPQLMCKQCGIKEGDIMSYEIIKELGKR